MKTFTIHVDGNTIRRLNQTENKDIFTVFEDLAGKKYLLAHGLGGYIFADDKIGRTSDQCYQTLVNRGLIKDGEEITVLCCHGALIAPCDNVRIANDEDTQLFIRRQELKDGSGSLICFTKSRFMNMAKAAAYAMFS